MASHNAIIYPGSFDPLTNGHLDLIERAAGLFDSVVVAVLLNDSKLPIFSAQERMEMIKETTGHLRNVVVDSFSGLLVEFANKRNARLILRGIRAVSDYEYELQMALMNRKLAPTLETIFMLPGEAYSYLSSGLVKEVYRHGGDIRDLVPSSVERSLRNKIGTVLE